MEERSEAILPSPLSNLIIEIQSALHCTALHTLFSQKLQIHSRPNFSTSGRLIFESFAFTDRISHQEPLLKQTATSTQQFSCAAQQGLSLTLTL
jgi:hypothetical protein